MPEIRDRIKELRRVPAKDLHANPENWRLHPVAQTSALLGMLTEVGFADAVLARELEDGTLELIDGHARQSLAGPNDLLPTLILDVNEEEARKLLLTLDPISAMADRDRSRLASLLDHVDTQDARATALLDAIRRDNRLPAIISREPPVVAPPTEPTTKPGDLWRLDDHRILCADATEPSSYRRLMSGEGASLVFTDPPYGVAYAAENFEAIRNDDRLHGDLVLFLRNAFDGIRMVMLPNAAAYIWHASSTRSLFESAMRGAGLEEIQYITWVKPSLVLGHADYQWQTEPCFYAAAAGEHPPFYGARTETTAWYVALRDLQAEGEEAIALGNGVLFGDGNGHQLWVAPEAPKGRKPRYVAITDRLWLHGAQPNSDAWELARDEGKAEHPTQKPIALAARAIENSSLPGQIVLDAFLGSGTTLLAAERLGRRCFALELEPGYVDVAVKRWETMTGRKATREQGVALSETTSA